MKPIASIFVEHSDAPRISTSINLHKWGIQHFQNLDSLVQYLKDALKEFWQCCNGQSIALVTIPHKQMLKYFGGNDRPHLQLRLLTVPNRPIALIIRRVQKVYGIYDMIRR